MWYLVMVPKKRRILLAQSMQRRSNGAKILHKAMIETQKTKETTHLMQVGWLRPSLNSIDLGLINMDTLGRDNETQENHFVNTKCALFQVGIKTFLLKRLQNKSNMIKMLFHGFAKHKNIIEVNHNKDSNVRSKYMMHKAHKSSGCFRQTHRHNQPLI